MAAATFRPSVDVVTHGLETKSDKIRALAKAGYSRVEIHKLLGIRYQHVRKVLVDAGIKEGLRPRIEVERSPVSIVVGSEIRRRETSPDILIDAGFLYVGEWKIKGDAAITLDGQPSKQPGVYALVLDGVLVYVGLTLSAIKTRMDQYRRGHAGQKTSARVHKLICAALENGQKVKVFSSSPEPLHWNGLPVNTAAGLEAGLIAEFKPPWNIQGAT